MSGFTTAKSSIKSFLTGQKNLKKGLTTSPFCVIIKVQKRKELIKMKHYLFEDLETGEEFIVGADCVTNASVTASEYFEEPHFVCRLTEFEAEASGLDEY